MLLNIKSPYIIKITLSYLNEERKLELVKYNKKIQNIININIINYFVENILQVIKMEKEKNMMDIMVEYYLMENM